MPQSTRNALKLQGRMEKSFENDDENKGEKETKHNLINWFFCKIGCRCVARFPQTWPRTFALIFGVIGPLWLLIGISHGLGHILAKLEAPVEIEANNAIIASRARVLTRDVLHSKFTANLPTICNALYFNGNEPKKVFDTIDEAIYNVSVAPFGEEDQALLSFIEEYSEIEEKHQYEYFVDVRNMTLFMMECGKQYEPILRAWVNSFAATSYGFGDFSLTFDWNRFSEGYDDFVSEDEYSYEDHALEKWKESQRELYPVYLNQSLSEGLHPVDARIYALQSSYDDATGFDDSEVNIQSGVWFWFTVMTTIGYGNTSPVSDKGKFLVFTAGFLSIIAFAGIVGISGVIITTIFDDFVNRARLSKLNKPWAQTIIWGLSYYAWMFGIALHTQRWKMDRLGEELSLFEGYWFVYSSSTTGGRGDIFLEPEGLGQLDLLVFPTMFLIGFVYLSNFLVKFTETIISFIPQNRLSLAERLKATSPILPEKWLTPEKQSETTPADREVDEIESSRKVNDGELHMESSLQTALTVDTVGLEVEEKKEG